MNDLTLFLVCMLTTSLVGIVILVINLLAIYAKNAELIRKNERAKLLVMCYERQLGISEGDEDEIDDI